MNFLLCAAKGSGPAGFGASLLASRPQNLLEQHVRQIAHGDMYTPKHLYMIRGPAKSNKHTLMKFRKMRAMKVIRLDLPELDSYYQKKLKDENPNEFAKKFMKLHGLDPLRPADRQTKFHIGCSNVIIDAYQPPENDGSFSEMAGGEEGILGAVRSKSATIIDKTKSVASRRTASALKKIRAADRPFDPKTFGERALNIYVEAHEALQGRDEPRLHDFVTEHAFPGMWDELERKTLRWQYVKSLEPPTTVHFRQGGSEESTFGQVTVRFHSQQKLAIYDQFGRLYMGNEHVSRDVLEYVVFENFLSNEYGIWRIHGKIASKKSSVVPAIHRTYVKKTDEKNTQEKFKYSLKLDEKTMESGSEKGGV